MGQWRYSQSTEKLTMAMQVAQRVYSMAQKQNNPALKIGAYSSLAVTLYNLGKFESARGYATIAVEIWRSGTPPSPIEEVDAPIVACLCFKALCEWHDGEIASCHATMAEATSLAKELNDAHSLAVAIFWTAVLGYYERKPAEVERCASDLIDLATHHNFRYWLACGAILSGWARSASGDTHQGVERIDDGIKDNLAAGTMISLPLFLALKGEALDLAGCTSEAIEAIRQAEAPVERFENRYWSAELQRLRGVFLAATGADETQIEASFCAAIKIAREQKSVSLEKRAEATYAEYLRQKDSGLRGRGCRLPLC